MLCYVNARKIDNFFLIRFFHIFFFLYFRTEIRVYNYFITLNKLCSRYSIVTYAIYRFIRIKNMHHEYPIWGAENTHHRHPRRRSTEYFFFSFEASPNIRLGHFPRRRTSPFFSDAFNGSALNKYNNNIIDALIYAAHRYSVF